MDKEIRLDETSTFGGKLRFLIPHDWIEKDEDSDDSCLFHPPDDDSGGLRVSLITVSGVKDCDQKLRQAFEDAKALTISKETGNWVDRWEKDSQEEGVPIHLYYWKVANAVPPDFVREAIFSYTVLAEQVSQPETQRIVQLLNQLVSQAEFAQP